MNLFYQQTAGHAFAADVTLQHSVQYLFLISDKTYSLYTV